MVNGDGSSHFTGMYSSAHPQYAHIQEDSDLRVSEEQQAILYEGDCGATAPCHMPCVMVPWQESFVDHIAASVPSQLTMQSGEPYSSGAGSCVVSGAVGMDGIAIPNAINKKQQCCKCIDECCKQQSRGPGLQSDSSLLGVCLEFGCNCCSQACSTLSACEM